jgi:hypothetical protein
VKRNAYVRSRKKKVKWQRQKSEMATQKKKRNGEKQSVFAMLEGRFFCT